MIDIQGSQMDESTRSLGIQNFPLIKQFNAKVDVFVVPIMYFNQYLPLKTGQCNYLRLQFTQENGDPLLFCQ